MANLLEIVLLNAAACTALACLVWTAGLLPAVRRRPALRYGLWMIVLVKLVTPPLIELRLMPYWRALTTIEREPISNVPIEVAVATMPASVPIEASAELPAMPLEALVVTEPAFDWRPWLLAAHITGVASILFLSLRQVRRLRRALRHSECEDERVLQIVRQASVTMGLARPPQVSLVNASVPPLLWVGRGGPLIVLPRGLVDEMSDEQLTCVVSHEIAHYLRRDHWGNAASWLVSAAFWWHPVVWWVRRELRITQEACCDALVISRSVASRQSYAQTLFQALEFLQSHCAPVPALASGFGGKSSTQRRFEMIANPKVNHRLSWWNYLLLLAALAALPFWPAISSAEEIALRDCPAAVQTTLQALQGAGQILKIERDADGEDQFYEAEVAINGKVYDVRVSDQGTLLSTVYSRVAEQSGEFTLHAQSIDIDGGTIELVFSSDDVTTATNSDSGVQGAVVIEEEHRDQAEPIEGHLEIQIAQDDAVVAEEALREEIRARLAQDQAAQVEQLQAEIARLMEQLKLLEANAAQNQNHQSSLQQVYRDLEIAQQRIAETERMRAVEAEERVRAELDAQVQQLEATQRQTDMQAEIVMQDRLLREHVAQQQQLAIEQQRLAERQQQQAERAMAQRRLIGGLPEAVRNTLAREAANGSITRITVTADDAGAVTYTAHVRYQTDAGPRAYEIEISEQGELLHKQLLRFTETRTIEVTPEGVRSRHTEIIEGSADGRVPAEQQLQGERIHYLELVPSEGRSPDGQQLEAGRIQGFELTPGEASSFDVRVGEGLQVNVPAPEASAYLELQAEILDSGEVQIEAVPVEQQIQSEATLDFTVEDAVIDGASVEFTLEGVLVDESTITEVQIIPATEEPAAETPASDEPAFLEPAPEEAPAETATP